MPSSCCSLMSSMISCCVASEQVNMAVLATTTSGSAFNSRTHLVDFDVVGDVAAALADVDSYPTLTHWTTSTASSASALSASCGAICSR